MTDTAAPPNTYPADPPLSSERLRLEALWVAQRMPDISSETIVEKAEEILRFLKR